MRAVLLGLLSFALLGQAFPVNVIDDRGREILIPKEPSRIVVLLPLYGEILVDLGLAHRVVGLARSPDNPPELLGLPEVGPSFAPSLEAIVALAPDLVLGGWGELRERLEALGIVVLTAGGPDGWIRGVLDVLGAIRTVGKALGKVEEAARLVGQICEEIVWVEAHVLGQPRISVAFLYLPAPDSPAYAAGAGTPEHEIILRAGGENAFSDVFGYPLVSLEELILRDPEVILTDPAQIGNFLASPVLSGLRAVQARRIYGLRAAQITSTRVAAALRELAQLLHPQAFR
ncbi:MAG: ABC transporter substrate-binding protein [Candidatus Bipolaricaulaceae bacterium]